MEKKSAGEHRDKDGDRIREHHDMFAGKRAQMERSGKKRTGRKKKEIKSKRKSKKHFIIEIESQP